MRNRNFLMMLLRPVLLFLVFLSFAQTGTAQGNLLIFPKRAVFEGDKNFEQFNLSNTSSDSAEYTLSFVRVKMNELGSFEPATAADSGMLFSDPSLRIYPRRVVLGPREAQVVKVQLARSNALAPGEYRSHLFVRAVPRTTGTDTTQKPDSGFSIVMKPQFGFNLPLIVRVGPNNTNAAIDSLKVVPLNDSTSLCRFWLRRDGNMSVYGSVTVEQKQGDRFESVAAVGGVAVYTPLARRLVTIPMKKSLLRPNTTLRITFMPLDDVRKPAPLTTEIAL